MSDISNHTTDTLTEGSTNLYYTTARADSDAKKAISATAPLSYDNATGAMSIPAGNLSVLTINGQVFDPLADSDKVFTLAAVGLDSAQVINMIDSAYVAARDSDLSFLDSAKAVSIIDSYVDSAFVALHQQYISLTDDAPTSPQPGAMWLETDTLTDPAVMIWDGSVWFEFPAAAPEKQVVQFGATAPADPFIGDLWLDNTDDTVHIWDGSIWFEFPQSVDSVSGSLAISDARFKDNVVSLDNALNKVSRLRGVEFDWNTGPNKGRHDIGVIAQEVEEVIPEVIHQKKMFGLQDAKTVDYEKLTAVLIEAVKDQQDQITELTTRIQNLENTQ